MICPFTRGSEARNGLCQACGTALPRNKNGSISKARKWCTEDCANLWGRNHVWGPARQWATFLNLQKHGLTWGDSCICDHCKRGILRDRLANTDGIEVNHIGPRYGEGYGNGCWNHQVNLEVLCHTCHVDVTKAQRAAKERGGQMAME